MEKTHITESCQWKITTVNTTKKKDTFKEVYITGFPKAVALELWCQGRHRQKRQFVERLVAFFLLIFIALGDKYYYHPIL